jgi:hypothetical protein
METANLPDRTRRQWVEALSIPLADGNSWGLALPSPRLRPEVVEGVDDLGRLSRTIRLVSEFGYPLEIRRLIDDLRFACDQGEAERQYETLFRLAAVLICRAHDIDLSVASSLLELDVADLPGFVSSVLSIVSGESSIKPEATRKGEGDG